MWIVFSLIAALSAGIVITLSKAGIKNMDPTLAFAIQAVLIIIISWSAVAWQGSYAELNRLDKRTWIYLILAGIITCISSLFSFQALKLGDAARVSPLDKVSLVFAIIFAVMFLKEKINWQLITGAVMMVAGAILIAMSKKAS